MDAEEEKGDQPLRHVPVLLASVLAAVRPAPDRVIVDGTFGAGGYTSAFLEAGADVVAIDRDPDAIAGGERLATASNGRLRLLHGRFADMDALVPAIGVSQVDAVVLDIGVSSMQIDEAARGFSFRRAGPLDMRMEGSGPSAADVVNGASEEDLRAVIGTLGEERQARRIAWAIVSEREKAPIVDTLSLARVVEAAIGGRPTAIHPATRTFQALRIFVNRELEQLALGLGAAERLLRPGGTLAVVSFHSLEDRIVKRFIQGRARAPAASRHAPPSTSAPPSTFRETPRGAIEPDAAEVAGNPRARSARLRVAERTDAPPRALVLAELGVPLLDHPGPEALLDRCA